MKSLGLRAAHQEFIDFLKARKKSSATVIAYRKDIAQMIDFLAEKTKIQAAHEINLKALQQFVAKLSKDNYTPKTVSRKINAIRTFGKFLSSMGYLENDPSGQLNHPKVENKPPRILSKTEYRALRDVAKNDLRAKAMIEILLQTGLRISELANVHVNDIRSKELYVRPLGNLRDRAIPLNKSALTAVKNYLSEKNQRPDSSRPQPENNDFVFTTRSGRPILVRNIRTLIEKYFKIAEVKGACVNDLRHTWVCHHLAAGVPALLVSKLAGHKRVATTEKYLDFLRRTSLPPEMPELDEL